MAEGNGSLFQVFPVAKSPERRAPTSDTLPEILPQMSEPSDFIQALEAKPAASPNGGWIGSISRMQTCIFFMPVHRPGSVNPPARNNTRFPAYLQCKLPALSSHVPCSGCVLEQPVNAFRESIQDFGGQTNPVDAVLDKAGPVLRSRYTSAQVCHSGRLRWLSSHNLPEPDRRQQPMRPAYRSDRTASLTMSQEADIG